VAGARAAFPYWSSLSGHERAKFLDAVAEAVKRRKQALCVLLCILYCSVLN
jgi:acyl-CoA reductase-like NAD-dependent aldehyde dehydrogenase